MQTIDTKPVQFTPDAISFIQRKLSNEPKALGLRISIKKGGCSGSSYDIQFAKEIQTDDTVIEKNGIKVVIDAQSFKFLNNTLIDCIKDDFGEFLKFQNPNVKGECGCGESVSFN